MSNISGVNGAGVNGSSSFDPVSEARSLGAINSFAINGNEAINGSSFVSIAINPIIAQFEQVVGVTFSGIIATIAQEVRLRSVTTGSSTELASFAQSVIQSFDGQIGQFKQWVVDDA